MKVKQSRTLDRCIVSSKLATKFEYRNRSRGLLLQLNIAIDALFHLKEFSMHKNKELEIEGVKHI